jgi:hypothetical protein
MHKNRDAKRYLSSQLTCEEKPFMLQKRNESQPMRPGELERYGTVSMAQRRKTVHPRQRGTRDDIEGGYAKCITWTEITNKEESKVARTDDRSTSQHISEVDSKDNLMTIGNARGGK